MPTPDCVVLDFETESIGRRPEYPPRPVGMAIKFPGERKGRYFAWGHDSGNNCTWGDAHLALSRAWESDYHILGQHMKFDLDVAQVHMQMSPLDWSRCEDTEYLLFLHDPHSKSLSLKPSAELILGKKPTERDVLRDWLVDHGFCRKTDRNWGAFIRHAPGELVGKYALDGDVGSTEGLFKVLYKEIGKRNMMAAYDRERRLMPILLKAERVGVRTDLELLEHDVPMYTEARERVALWLRKKLGVAVDFNLDKKGKIAEVLNDAGAVKEWIWTKGGKNKAPQRSVSKKSMSLDKFADPQFAQMWGYYNRCGTVLNMFLKDWLEVSRQTGGHLHPNWNQTRQGDGKQQVGTRTGRPSCDSPNLFNVAKAFENNKGDGYYHPKFFKGLPELPLCRKYILPDKDGVFLHRDINQQELRMLAHFEDGELCERYNKEPRFDIHTLMQKGITEIVGIDLGRDRTKIVDFSSIYGKGRSGLAADLGIDEEMTRRILAAKAQLMPGVDHPQTGLAARIKLLGKQGGCIRTWGGREYYAEEPRFVEKYNRVMDFNYKLLNYLIQPSSADYTKEAIIQYDAHPKREGRFLVAVYDEIDSSTASLKRLSEKAKKDAVTREMLVLRQSMEDIPGVDVPMLTDGKTGPNWGDLVFYDKPALPWGA